MGITPPIDRVIWRKELREALGVTNESIRRWIKSGKLPPPDVSLSRKVKGWRASTLSGLGFVFP
ncbi:hypothetical protein AGMMS50256_34600 [Betaproteobacteria bacterium]|nr:hypothetical protein AGMMS50256_34600 [Betaproteobacteria bacterium]